MGIGLNYGAIPGVSIRWYFTKAIGAELNGWYSSSNGQSFSSFEFRGIFILGRIMFNEYPGRGYGVFSVGSMTGTAEPRVDYQIADISLGIEMPMAGLRGKRSDFRSRHTDSSFIDGLFFNENAYLSSEVGIGDYRGQSRYQGIVGRLGFRYYF